MAQKKTLVVELVGDDRSLRRALNRSEKGMGKWAKKAAGFSTAFGTAGAILGAAAIKEAREAEKVGKQTDAALRSTGRAAKVSRKEIEGLANSLSLKSGIDDEAIQSAQNMLLTFTKVRQEVGKGNQIFSQASTAVVDVAARMAATGGRKAGAPDLKTASIQIGKALNDPIKGLTSLTRVGVQFDAQQRKQIQTMVSQGNTLGAQKVVMRELRTEFGGSAAANADGMDRMKVAIDNMLESLGGKMLPTINAAAGAMAKFINQLRTGQGVGGRVAAGFRSVTAAISGFVARNRETFKDIQMVARTASRVLVAVFRDFTIPGFRRVLAGMRQIWSGMFQTFRGAVKVISSIIRGDFAGVLRGMRTIVAGSVRGALGALRALTAPFRQAAVVIGKNVVGGLLDGIGSLAGRVADAGRNLGRTLLNAAKDFLGISSPSKEFAKVGGHVVSGFAKGLSAGNVMGVVKKHFGGMTKFATELVTGGALKLAKLPLSALSKIGGLFGGSKIQGGIQGGALVGIGRRLQQMGFQVGEHPAFGGVQGRHVRGSFHGRGRAIDVNWPNKAEEPQKLDQIKAMLRRVPHQELLWRAPGHMPGSNAHLHLAMRRGGLVPGAGSGDKVPVMAEAGEGFLNKRAVAAMGGKSAIDALNAMVPRFQSGGVMGRAAGALSGKSLHRLVYVAINRAMTPAFSRWAKRRYGMSGKRLLAKVAAVEGGGTTQNPNVSYAGARGPFQFIPSTRASFKSKFGLDAWRTNTEAAKAAMIHLQRYGGVRGYNPGMPAYEGMVLRARVNTAPLITGGRSRSRGRAPDRRSRKPRKSWAQTLKEARKYERGTAGRTSIADDAWTSVGEAAMAQAALTPSFTDDISAARLVNTIASNRYLRAVQSGDPKRIAETAGALGSAREGLFSATAAPGAAMAAEQERQRQVLTEWAAAAEQAKEAARASKEAAEAMATEMRLNRQLAERINSTSNAVAWKALADIMSGQIGNTVSQRAVSAGDGRMARF